MDFVSVCVYLCVYQHVIEQYEPVVGEPAGALWNKRSVAAFTHNTALWEMQNLLENTQANSWLVWCIEDLRDNCGWVVNCHQKASGWISGFPLHMSRCCDITLNQTLPFMCSSVCMTEHINRVGWAEFEKESTVSPVSNAQSPERWNKCYKHNQCSGSNSREKHSVSCV